MDGPSRQDSGGLPASMTKPHQLLRQPSQQEEPAASHEEVTPLQFSPSACQGGDVTWATSAISPATAPTAEATRRPGSPAWESRACGSSTGGEGCPWECDPRQGRRDSERAGSAPPRDGAAALLLAAASGAQAHTARMLPPCHEGCRGAPGAAKMDEPARRRIGFQNFSPVRSQSCAASMKPPAPGGYFHLT